MLTFKKTLIFTTLLSVSFLFNACSNNDTKFGENVKTPGNQPFSTGEKEFVNNLFNTEYLWYDEVASDVDYNAYDTPQSLVTALSVPQDHWSFAITAGEYEDLVGQKTQGFGFSYIDDLHIYTVRIGSPAYTKLLRGDKILEVNGASATFDNISSASQNLGKPTTFKVLRGSSEVSVDVVPKSYTYKVTMGKVINGNIGYLSYDEFTGSSVAEFEAEFTKFKAAGIKDIIVDLRYNGGGSVEVGSILLENLTNRHAGKRQFYLDWNENYKSKNVDYYFSTEVEPNDLNMQRVVFLVSRGTASASELVISALKPYLGEANVVTIGDYTHGKSVGMEGRAYGKDYYFLINFYVKNNMGLTSSANGITPTCVATDDITHLRGDPEEAMLKSAINYINTGNCL